MRRDSEIEGLRRERDLYRRMLELGDKGDLAPFLEEALALVVEVTGARKGFVELEGGFSVARALSEADIADVRRALSSGIIAEAIATGRTVSTASAVEDPRFAGHASVQAARLRAVLCAPIRAIPHDATTGGASRPLGVVYLEGRSTPGPFAEDERSLAELFARHVAPFVDRLLAGERAPDAPDATRALRAELAVDRIAGTSRALAEVLRQVKVAAPVPVSVLITGESGTGKTAIARALHESSPRAKGPFVEVNCAALPEALFESELFGAEKGAHSTAHKRTPGKVDAANGGTLFLDEIGEVPLALQSKLLMFLQSRRYFRLGSTEPIEADVRVVAATNQDLAEAVKAKRFREDLFYRLDVLRVHVPPLRERRQDIGPIAEAIVRELGRTAGRPTTIARSAKAALAESDWPGNVRQLENALQRGWATALSEGVACVEVRHLFPERPAPASDEPLTYDEAVHAFRGRLVRETLDATSWNVSEAARRLDVSRSHLNDLMKAHGLARAGKKDG